MKKNFYDVNDAGKTFLWCLILPQILYLVFEILIMAYAGEKFIRGEGVNTLPIVLISTMLAQVAFGLIFWRTTKHTSPIPAGKINIKSFGWQNTLICVLIGIIGLFAFTPISSLFTEGLTALGFGAGSEESKFEEVLLTFLLSSPFALILGIVLLAGVPAVIEELIFRGVILQGLRKFGTIKAVLLTSALFALVHLNAEQLVFPFIFSIVLCLLVIKTNSIVSSMIVHFVSNATSLLMMYFGVSLAIPLPIWALILIAIACVAVGYGIIWLLSKFLKNTEKQRSTDEVLEAVGNAQNMQPYNPSTQNLKIAVVVGIILWLINFVYAFSVV